MKLRFGELKLENAFDPKPTITTPSRLKINGLNVDKLFTPQTTNDYSAKTVRHLLLIKIKWYFKQNRFRQSWPNIY